MKIKVFPLYGLQIRWWIDRSRQQLTIGDNFFFFKSNIHSNRLDVFQLQIKYTRLLDWLWQSRFWERNLRLCTSAFLISTFSKLTIKTSKKSRRKICAGRKTIFHGSKNQGKWCKSWVFFKSSLTFVFSLKKKLIVPRLKQKLHFHILSICKQCIHVSKSCSCLPVGYWW